MRPLTDARLPPPGRGVRGVLPPALQLGIIDSLPREDTLQVTVCDMRNSFYLHSRDGAAICTTVARECINARYIMIAMQ